MGSSPAIVSEWIEELDLLTRSSRILDLGCGKGAVSIPLAERFGSHVDGFDLFEPFIAEARARAVEAGVESRCSFQQADIKEILGSGHEYDMVIFSSIGFILGSVKQTIEHLRRCVRHGKYLVLEDGCLAGHQPISDPDYVNYLPYDETIRQITAFGDRILREKILSADEMKRMNHYNTQHISRRVKMLAERYPDQAGLFFEYLDQEKAECRILETAFQGAVWLIQKTPG